MNIFNSHRKKILDEKCIFIAISFYRNIAMLFVKISRVNKALKSRRVQNQSKDKLK